MKDKYDIAHENYNDRMSQILNFASNIKDDDVKYLIRSIIELMKKNDLICVYEEHEFNIDTINESKNEFNKYLNNCYNQYSDMLEQQSAPKM